jgi:hypothetical protein
MNNTSAGMLSALKQNLDSIYIISRRIINYNNGGYGNLKTITQSVFYKYKALHFKFIQNIEKAKKVIDSDILRNNSISYYNLEMYLNETNDETNR